MEQTKRIGRFVAAIVFSVLLLAGGQWIWQRTQVELPVRNSLEKVQNIKDWKLKEQDGKLNIAVTLQGNANLEATYQNIDDGLAKVLGSRPYSIDFQNSADTKLDDFFETVQPILYEGISTGRYTWLVSEITKQAEDKQLTAKVVMDEKFVYLELHSGSKALYKLIPRSVDTSIGQG